MTRRVLLIIAALLFSSVIFAGAADEDKYTVHVVKWYEDLAGISGKYGVPEDVIIAVNNLQDKKISTRQKLLIPTSEKYWPAASAALNGEDGMTGQDGPAAMESDTLSPLPTSIIRFALAMPLSGEKATNNNMDFYSGALMAVRALGNEGLDVELDVRDLGEALGPEEGFEKDDFIIGPIHNNDMKLLLEKVDSLSVVVSPLDNRAGNVLGAGHRFFVQAGASSESQWGEAFDWARDIFAIQDTVKYVIISSDLDKAVLREAENMAKKAGLAYSVCTVGVQGEITDWETTANPPGQGHNAVILAITNEAILNNAVRNTHILTLQGNVSVFAGSKIRSYETIPVENLHRVGIHALCPYYVDYEDATTLDFIHQYRALFNIEPSQFAFQGYDLVYFMVKSYAKYGRNWKYLIGQDDATDMLQTSFKIRRSANGVLTNCGMKRVLYGTDCRVRLSK